MRCVGPSVTDRLKKSGWGKWGREGKKRRAGRDLLPVRYWCSCVHVQHSMYYWDLLFRHHVSSSLSHTKGKRKKKNEFSADSEMEDVSTASHFCRRRKKKTCCKWVSHKSLDPKTQVIISPSVLLQVKSVYITRGRHVISFFSPPKRYTWRSCRASQPVSNASHDGAHD